MKRFYRIPNELFSKGLSTSAFVIYVLLSNKFYFTDTIRIKLKTISSQSGLSCNTVRAALNELNNNGLIYVTQRYKHGLRTTSEYAISKIGGNFSRVEVNLFHRILNETGKSALMIFCAVNSCANGSGRAFPSYTKISELTGLSRVTCIEKIKCLRILGVIVGDHYITVCGDFGNNNYSVLDLKLRFFLFKVVLIAGKGGSSSMCNADTGRGGKIFDKHIIDPPKYARKIEKKKRILHTFTDICDIIQDIIQKVRKKAVLTIKKLRRMFKPGSA